MKSVRVKQIQTKLLRWYATEKRDLPWRHTRDPYKILVSEVMLQQTQVDRVIPKYHAWLKTWPTVQTLADAPLAQVLRAWSGLGYNRRAVHLRLAARMIVEKFGGVFPTNVEQLETLPGVGIYTAKAVAAFAYGQPVGLIDINVRRVVSRVQYGVRGPQTARQFQTAVDRLVPVRQADTWQHALMDLGATVCVSRRPKCEVCPLQNICRAYPAILNQSKLPSKPAVAFADSDRFWRGRIVAAVLLHPRASLATIQRQLASYGQLKSERFEKLIKDLTTHGLIERRGKSLKVPT